MVTILFSRLYRVSNISFETHLLLEVCSPRTQTDSHAPESARPGQISNHQVDQFFSVKLGC